MKYRKKSHPEIIVKAVQYTGVDGEYVLGYPKWVKKALENGELSYEKDGLRCRCTNQKIKLGGYIVKDEVALVRTMEEFEENFEPLDEKKKYIQEIKVLKRR